MAADLKTKEKLAKQDAVQEVPKSHKGLSPCASRYQTWRWVWNPLGGTSRVLGAHRPRVARASQQWWRERRGVGKAEVPGEADSEGNRPKGATPV